MHEENKYDVSIVIPCYQEEKHILDSVKEIYKVLNETKYKFEIIFIEDKSIDRTKEKISEIEQIFPNVHTLFHEKNLGKGASIMNGSKIARGKFVGHIDIDLEISANYLPNIIAELEKGNDIVLVQRKISFNPQFILRDVGGMIHRSIVRHFLSIPYTDVQSGCKFFKKEVLLTLLENVRATGWFFDVELITHAYHRNYSVKQIPGSFIRSKKKKSTVKLFRDGMEQIKSLIKFRKQIKKEKMSRLRST